MSKYEHRAIILSSLAALGGLVLAVYLEGGHWFGRSGAVITVIAIVFGSLELREKVAEALPFTEEQLQQRRPELLKLGADAGLDKSSSEAVAKRAESEILAETKEAMQFTSKRLLQVEVSLLVIGTLIWGFGDLPLDYLFPQQAATCFCRETCTPDKSGHSQLPKLRSWII